MVVLVVLDNRDPFVREASLGDEYLHWASSLSAHAVAHSGSWILLEMVAEVTTHFTSQQDFVRFAILEIQVSLLLNTLDTYKAVMQQTKAGQVVLEHTRPTTETTNHNQE